MTGQILGGNFPKFGLLFILMAFWSCVSLFGGSEVSAAPVQKPDIVEKAPPGPAATEGPSGIQFPGFGKYRVVRIDRDGVFPQVVNIEAGSTVIWFNATDTYSSVVFNEGVNVNNSTRSPTLFFLAPDGTYVSAAFAAGATASTAFITPGTYRYFVTGLPVSEGTAFAQIVVK